MIRAIVGIITRCSIVAVALAGCEASSPDGGTPRSGGDSSALPFVDVATERGVHFRHDNGARGERVLPETMGGGGGFLDFDLDGDFDLVSSMVACSAAVNRALRTDSSKTMAPATSPM